MKPKDKALELINRMNNVDLNCKNESMCMLYPHAIECALIAVNEMLENDGWSSSIEEWDKFKVYFQKVREQIIIVSKSI